MTYTVQYMLSQVILAIEGGVVIEEGPPKVYRQVFGEAMLKMLKKTYRESYNDSEMKVYMD